MLIARLLRDSHPRSAPASTRRHVIHSVERGQTLVEFALTLMIFMLLTLGLLDGLRVIFYYSQIQEAAREGSRWASVDVARTIAGPSSPTVGGDFSLSGNAPGTYSGTALMSSRWTDSSNITPTIVGATLQAANAVDLRQVTITIETPITKTTEISPTTTFFTNLPITVTVSYPFKPILGIVFGGVQIPLKGTSVMLHE